MPEALTLTQLGVQQNSSILWVTSEPFWKMQEWEACVCITNVIFLKF